MTQQQKDDLIILLMDLDIDHVQAEKDEELIQVVMNIPVEDDDNSTMKKETKEAAKRFEEKLKGGFFTPRKKR